SATRDGVIFRGLQRSVPHRATPQVANGASMLETAVLELHDLAATEMLGRQLGTLLFPGAVVALIGPLGAGKTQLVRAIAEGLGISDSRAVSSPTFVLI